MMFAQRPEPVGLPLLPIALRQCPVDDTNSSEGFMFSCPRDDFGDSPRDHVFAHLDRAGGESPWSPAELPSLLTSPPPAARSRKGAKKSKQHVSARAGSGVNCQPSDAAEPGLPLAPGTPPAATEGSVGLGAAAAGAEASRSPSNGGSPRGPESWPEGATTVMLRNIPNRYTAEEVLAEMLAVGFDGTFDFFYLPIDFNTKRNRGYSFINFRKPDDAHRFVTAFHNLRLTRYATQKILEVSPALTQGFEANVAQYVRKDAQRIQNPWFRPMIFEAPREGAAPEAANPDVQPLPPPA
eukprot:CAMPEP_0168504174 /NCGR_PEP_ID=MMETSP0228-20121227/76234_1 /TAXON_ID=133427 /ORGANISM="Protoceratium reticulatum, Strain CCCM 535 (=CCMP 1889)" /LENGTH=295 /DNA_ID=CAMNT_0008521251 /DNA_START=24 /DNA_END=908 /DNA_ORIENTATION=-